MHPEAADTRGPLPHLRLLAVVIVLAGAPPAVGQAPTYSFSLLQVNGALATGCAGRPINDSNQVAGSAVMVAGSKSAAYWSSPFAPGTLLPGLGGRYADARAINNNGAMAGTATTTGDANLSGVYWASPGAAPVALSAASPETNSTAQWINNAIPAQIAGTSLNTFTLSPPATTVPTFTYVPVAATAWNASPTAIALPSGTSAWGVNDTPEIVGIGAITGTSGPPLDWTSPLGSAAHNVSCGSSVGAPILVNNAGAVTAIIGGSAAVCPSGATNWTTLTGGAGAGSSKINDAGWIVNGTSTGALHLWVPQAGAYGAPIDLSTYLPASLAGTGWAFTADNGINNNGWIAGTISNSGSGLTQCFVLSPVSTQPGSPGNADIPLPAWTLLALGAALGGTIALRRRRPRTN